MIDHSEIVMGIDAGTAITGWGVVNMNTLKVLGSGIITTHKFSNHEDRLVDLGEAIQELLTEFKPSCMAIEKLFFFRNATTVINVAQARGVVIYEARKAGLDIFGYTPLEIKQGVTGYGRATKKQMLTMVNKLYKFSENTIKQDDAADALAVAYIHSKSRVFRR